MKLKKFYISLFIISLAGLLVVQYQYLRIGLNLAKFQFNEKLKLAETDIRKGLETENQLSFLIAKGISKDEYFKLSPDSVQDASRHFLNDYVGSQLSAHNIRTEYSYRLLENDSTEYLHSPKFFEEEEAIIKYPIELEGYLPGSLGRPLILELQFQDLNSYFLSQINGLIIPSLVFLAGIVLVVIWVFRKFYLQTNVITITNDFINNLTHELKTPVFSIGVATKILESNLTEKQAPMVEIIRQQSDRLNKHIDQVLELASLESQKKLVQLQKVDLRPFLEEWCRNFEKMALIEEFSFRYELEPGEYKIMANLPHLENSVLNLLDNARKYSEDAKILLKAYPSGRTLVISVSDNGPGIPASEKTLIFKKYYRIPSGNLHKVKGHGLGLSYVKEIVKRHHGKIEIESRPNQGTTMYIKLPLKNG